MELKQSTYVKRKNVVVQAVLGALAEEIRQLKKYLIFGMITIKLAELNGRHKPGTFEKRWKNSAHEKTFCQINKHQQNASTLMKYFTVHF